jgi:protein-disulfide isomerase
MAAIAVLNIATIARAEMQRADVEAIVEQYLSSHPEAVERIVRDTLARNPDIVRDALAELIKRRMPAASGRAAEQDAGRTAAILDNARQLLDSPHHVSLGNPQGDVTLVEFFDYNCGYCRRALADALDLLRDDPKLRFVLKELPILGANSVDAARVSVAVRMQDSTGQRYLDFHRRLLGSPGSADKGTALAAAENVGFDRAQLERDLASEEVRESLAESASLARALGVRGTPAYVVGTVIIPGAIGAARLKEAIAAARATNRR